MPSCRAVHGLAFVAIAVALVPSLSCNGPGPRPLLPRSQTWAELRTIRRGVTVRPPEEGERAPYPRERLVDGEGVKVAAEGLVWLRRDGGATLLVRGAADLTVRSDAVEIAEGRVFVDTPAGRTTEILTPGGPLHLAHVRASIDVSKGATEVYVLSGEVRAEGTARAAAGERLTVTGSGKEARAAVAPVVAWDDWTGGLATTDRAAEPAPYGVGTVGARRAGEQGTPRFPLAIQKLDIRVKVDGDFALTEVDEVFFNPSSEVVEGVYRFRTPDGAALHRFGVDRDGAVVWGRVKEKAAAAAQYQANVYQGSTEDPALLEWDAPGVYRARLYPIGPGETRRVVVTYAEWLGRTGPKHNRRLYVYPMAAQGPEESLPHIEEMYAKIDLSRAGARDVRAGMAGVREGDMLVVREHDLVPRADLSVEIFDEEPTPWRGYLASHMVDTEALPPNERNEALQRARKEAEYVLVPVRDGTAAQPEPEGLDLSVVIDTSAATETAALAIARAATGALLAHLGKNDRAVVWAGDARLRPVVPGHDKLAPLDDAGRREVLARLAATERGGATDLGAMLAEAAQGLDPSPSRRGVVVYVGDGAPTVGELSLADLQGRLSKLPRPVRIFGLGVGDGADMAILSGLSRGAFAERIGDANAAARAALRLLEVAERPARVGASVDLGPNVERVFPRDLGALVEGEGQVVIGRLVGPSPQSFTVKSAAGETAIPLKVTAIDDHGDLSRRWALGRLAQMIDEGVGRAAMVDLGSRHGIITPVTSLYVPTKNEMSTEERAELERRRAERRGRAIAGTHAPRTESAVAEEQEQESDGRFWSNRKQNADNKEGGTGTRAKGEEGSMGNPNFRGPARHHAAAGKPEAYKNELLPDSSGAAAAAPVAAASAAPLDLELPTAKAAMTRAAPGSPVATAPAPQGQPAAPRPAADDVPRVKLPVGNATPTTPTTGDTVATLKPAEDRPRAPADRDGDGLPDAFDKAAGDVGGLLRNPFDSLDATKMNRDGWSTNGQPAQRADQFQLSLGNAFGSGAGRLGGEHAAREAVAEKSVAGPMGAKKAALQQGLSVTFHLGDVSHFAFFCGGAAMVPFEERVGLWRERLAAVSGNSWAVADVYHRALANCEAPTWRERSRLTSMLLDAMPSVQGKVTLWRTMFGDGPVADGLYRGLLARVRSPVELRQLHDALGLKSIDPGVLAKLLKDEKSVAGRVKKLRDLVYQWPDDFALALKLLDTLEDAGDDSAARELGRKLRARADADARVRTAVGELYLRISGRDQDATQKALDEAEARRAFGEIVEFAPDDPVARRRLGDLLRAHGWYAEAARQYETLARLAPDDASVSLLLAAAAEGMGKLEEAVQWTRKGGSAGSPDADAGPARTARAFAATWLAWGRAEALAAGKTDEAKALGARLAQVRSTERLAGEVKGTRVTLTWAHPELHPSLWTNALGALMPAPDADVTLGVAAATVRDGALVEVRVEGDEVEHAARLGAVAVLTVVFDEGGQGERIVKTRVAFSAQGPAARRFSLAGSAVKEVTP